ncbi:TIGR03088 family PEP-CTERM/XrtA system glycosyltransferase [Roseateles sp. DB2]|uniref:TIGR03088 family PEP-CTERM/XrtA system glycosyltransferase n=1 Tax=Roseateles sp. DB2 TaxID=3453717 RepID=UPI003EE9B4F2
MKTDSRLHVMHLVYRFSSGGLENVVTQLINGLPRDRFRHTLVALTEVDPVYRSRIETPDVQCIALDKQPGGPLPYWPRAWRLFREQAPDVLHSCNLAAMDFLPMAALAAVPRRIHAEHGWDVSDPGGSNLKNRRNRRLMAPFVQDFVAVSDQVRDYLRDIIQVPPARIQLITNGVDTARFRPMQTSDAWPAGLPFQRGEHLLVGTVGRLDPVKDQARLIDAFARLQALGEEACRRARLVLVGEGPLRQALGEQVAQLGLQDRVYFAGQRQDVPAVLRALDVFVLNSVTEGTSCALQEALATGMGIVATTVGGNAAVLGQGSAGHLVPPSDTMALTQGLRQALAQRLDPVARQAQQEAARERAMNAYSLQAMLARYERLFASRKGQVVQ